jgi:hypothetical protein
MTFEQIEPHLERLIAEAEAAREILMTADWVPWPNLATSCSRHCADGERAAFVVSPTKHIPTIAFIEEGPSCQGNQDSPFSWRQ